MHLLSLLHTVWNCGWTIPESSLGGNEIQALVSMSLRLGNLLYPIKGSSLRIFLRSSVFWIMFQLSLINDLIKRFFGL